MRLKTFTTHLTEPTPTQGSLEASSPGLLPTWVRERATNWSLDGDCGASATPSDSSPQFLTVAEVAALLRVSERTVRRHIGLGKIPHMRVGRQVRIPRAVQIGRAHV